MLDHKEVQFNNNTGLDPEKEAKWREAREAARNSPRSRHLSMTSQASVVISESDENQERGNWSGRLDFIMSCLSYAVGLGNVWRYPFKCYENGGGAFVFPFLIMLVFTGVPLFFLETAFGQYASNGVVNIWKAVPLCQGVGYAMFIVSYLGIIYYNMIIAWSFFYLFASFTTELPWATCDNEWNTEACRVKGGRSALERNCMDNNGTWFNRTCLSFANASQDTMTAVLSGASAANDSIYTVLDLGTGGRTNGTASNITYKSPSDEYFHKYVLDISEGIHDVGHVRWQIALCLFLAWTVACFCMINGIKTSGKVVYFTATFPYIVLTILLVRGITLPGSTTGILYYVTPQWEKLATPKVWGDAAIQIFYSLSTAWGGLITLSSYNKFKNNCLRDTYIVCVGDAIASLFAGLVIFAIVGFMAHELEIGIDKAATGGAGLAFIAYPEVVTRLPVAPLWAILFFLMLITLGLGTMMANINTVHTTIMDMFPHVLRVGRRPSYLMVAICSLGFVVGLSMCTQGGMYVVEIFDDFCSTYSVNFIAIVELVALGWIYGFDRLRADIKLMLGYEISIMWKIAWKFVSPFAILFITCFNLIAFKKTKYEDYEFPLWAELIGFFLASLSFLVMPGTAIYKICTVKDRSMTIIQRIKFLCQPAADWGPGCKVIDNLPDIALGATHEIYEGPVYNSKGGKGMANGDIKPTSPETEPLRNGHV